MYITLLLYTVQMCELSWFNLTIIYFLESKKTKDIQSLQ